MPSPGRRWPWRGACRVAALVACTSRLASADGGDGRRAVSTDEIGGSITVGRGNRAFVESDLLQSLPCSSPLDEGPFVRFVFPFHGSRLDSIVDLSLARTLFVRMRVGRFKLGVEGRIALIIDGIMSDLRGVQASERPPSELFRMVMPVGTESAEIFGLTEGRYSLRARLIDWNNTGRDCWKGDAVNFTIENMAGRNRSATLLAGMRAYQRRGRAQKQPFFQQPGRRADFGYVTVFWGEQYLDNVIAWSAGLRAVGSSFPIYCLVIQEMLWEGYAEVLRRCCCEVIGVEPIRWEGPLSQRSRYELVLTKLRVYQLARRGLKKVVLMDADMLVLQNIDELFWLPAPSASALIGTYLGDTQEPKMSAGVLVLEPSESEFSAIMCTLDRFMRMPASKSQFFEQDLLDFHWSLTRPGLPYNVLPFIYNLDPRMLDVLPFLSPQVKSESLDARFPLDHGIKAVHLWNWYNPLIASSGSTRQSLQLNARLKHKCMWHWYDLWWRLHQEGLERGVPEKFPVWRAHCVAQNHRFGPEHAEKFVPVLKGGGGACFHSRGGLAW